MTCDNAANNNTMIKALSELVPTFMGTASQTRCFLHVINLIAKTLLHQFDAKKADLRDTELAKIGVDGETAADTLSESGQGDLDFDDNTEATNNVEGWIDESDDLTAEEVEQLERATRPIRSALFKV